MNTKYPETPELIAALRTVNSDGNDTHLGDRVTSVHVNRDKKCCGMVQIDVREFRRGINLILEIELSELIPALSLATLNAEREDE